MKVVVVVNRQSRQGAKALARIPELFGRSGVALRELHAARDGEDLARFVLRAVKNGAKHVVVGGGDGAMTLAVRALAHSKTTLGVLPLGTGNSFADSLRIPFDLEGAVEVIARGVRARVDLGRVNGTYFAGFATIGFPSIVARSTNHGLKRLIGMGAYAAAAIVPLLRGTAFRCTVRAGSGRFTIKTRHLIIANGRYFGHAAIAPNATIVDGKLTLFTTASRTGLDIASAYLALGLGQQARLPNVHLLEAKKIVVETKPAQPLDVDGDAFGRTPATFRVAPKALRVFVPAAFVDAQQ